MIAATLRLGECFPRASLCYIAILLYTNAVAKKKSSNLDESLLVHNNQKRS